jgi:thioredoxin-dependent peroxiredoxin
MRTQWVLAVAAACWMGCGKGEPATDASAPADPAVTATAATAAGPRRAGSMPQVGETAPNFRVKDQSGKVRTLEEFRGKRVVLWFFPKADTPGWTVEGCGFRDRSPDFAAKNVQLIGASFDSVAAQAAFAKGQKFAFPLLADTDKRLAIAYGVADSESEYPRRVTFVIGPDGKIEQVLPKVDVRTHAATILESLPAGKWRLASAIFSPAPDRPMGRVEGLAPCP